MIRLRYIFFLFLISTGSRSLCQDTLPKISVKNISNKIIVSWKNNYGANISTINIQRSYDSIKNFTTIGSVLEPMNRENGFVDNKEPTAYVFYRVFVAFEGGRYIFSKSYRPVKDSAVGNSYEIENRREVNTPASTESITSIPAPITKAIAGTTPGTKLYRVPPPLPLPPPPTPKNLFVASKFIYTGKDNNIILDLVMVSGNRFSVKFFDEKDNMIFEIKKIAEPYLIIEKVNFKHAGWFYFKLFDNGILKEKNKFYIPKEGKPGIPPNELNRPFK
jgi:hypothetical protein